MNRPISREPPARARKSSVSVSAAAKLLLQHQQQGRAVKDESLDFFSSLQKCQPDDVEELTTNGTGMPRRSGIIDELLSTDIGKHDYDWLLTPPATPVWSSINTGDRRISPAAPKGLSRARSISAMKTTSRLSLTQRENENSGTRPARSSSARRSSISTTSISSGHLSSIRTSSSVLTTSSASVNSKPSAPAATRPGMQTTARTAATTPSPRPVASSPFSPAKARQVSSSVADKSKTRSDSRSSTPGARPRATSATSSPRSITPTSRAASQQPTPTRCNVTAAATPAKTRSSSGGRTSSTGSRSAGSTPRARSPAPQVRGTARRVPALSEVTPDMPSDSKMRQRQGTPPMSAARRPASPPVATRSRLQENLARSQLNGDGQKANAQKAMSRRAIRSGSDIDSSALTRTGSRKSVDGIAKHTEIRHGVQAIRKATLYPRSSRSGASRGRLGSMSMGSSAANSEEGSITGARSVSENGDSSARSQEGELGVAVAARMAELDA